MCLDEDAPLQFKCMDSHAVTDGHDESRVALTAAPAVWVDGAGEDRIGGFWRLDGAEHVAGDQGPPTDTAIGAGWNKDILVGK